MISIQYWLNLLKEKKETEGLTPFERYHYNMMKLSFDPSPKYIGDRVMIWDTSLVVDHSNDHYIESNETIYAILKYECIVIETDNMYEVLTNSVLEIDILDRVFLDLVLYIPNLGIKIRTHSDFVCSC